MDRRARSRNKQRLRPDNVRDLLLASCAKSIASVFINSLFHLSRQFLAMLPYTHCNCQFSDPAGQFSKRPCGPDVGLERHAPEPVIDLSRVPVRRHDNNVRFELDDRLERWIRHASDLRFFYRFRWVVAEVRHPDDSVAEPEAEQDLRRGRGKRDDAAWK